MIGSALSAELEQRGYEVRHLSRSKGTSRYRTFPWNIENGQVEEAAFRNVDHIIHLAGAGIADERWTKRRVSLLIESRAKAARLLHRKIKELRIAPKSFISAAGIGYYGAHTSDHIFKESDPPGTDTIAQISMEWEAAVREWEDTCRTVRVRTPVVLSANGGALTKLAMPVKWGLGAALGSGRQWMPWIHLDDLVAFYIRAIEDPSITGAYNVVAGNATNSELMRTIAKVLRRPYFVPNVPGFALRLVLGDLSSILLEGSRVDNDRIRSVGLQPRYSDLRAALEDLLR